MTRNRFERPMADIERTDRIAQDEQAPELQHDDRTVAECRGCGDGLTPTQIELAGGRRRCGECLADLDPEVFVP